MKKSYGKKTTVNRDFGKADRYIKLAELVGKYEKEELAVLGYFTNLGKYGVTYTLCVLNGAGEKLGVNIPEWLGASIEEDFKDSGETADTYFSGEDYIKEVVKVPTDKGNPTYNIILF